MRRKKGKIDWIPAPDIKRRIRFLIKAIELETFKPSQIHCYRSVNANTRAYARIWGLSRIWQLALKIKPAYVLEVISEKFDKLSDRERDRVLLHELAHIPMNFSGALVPHKHGVGNFHDKLKGYERLFDSRRE